MLFERGRTQFKKWKRTENMEILGIFDNLQAVWKTTSI